MARQVAPCKQYQALEHNRWEKTCNEIDCMFDSEVSNAWSCWIPHNSVQEDTKCSYGSKARSYNAATLSIETQLCMNKRRSYKIVDNKWLGRIVMTTAQGSSNIRMPVPFQTKCGNLRPGISLRFACLQSRQQLQDFVKL